MFPRTKHLTSTGGGNCICILQLLTSTLATFVEIHGEMFERLICFKSCLCSEIQLLFLPVVAGGKTVHLCLHCPGQF